MFNFLYNAVIILAVSIYLPIFLVRQVLFQKSGKAFLSRLFAGRFFKGDVPHGGIWIHAVSLGEIRAAASLIREIEKKYPNVPYVISNTTHTGHREAKKLFPKAGAHFFLPMDITFVVRKFVKAIKPKLFIGVESDYWYGLFSELKKAGSAVVIVNGKVSRRSTSRYQKLGFFSKKLFGNIDQICVQNGEYKESFEKCGFNPEKITVTGNLKFDFQLELMKGTEKSRFINQFKIKQGDSVVTLGSTHYPEEEKLLSIFEKIWLSSPRLKLFLVPRHPHRFEEVENILKTRQIPYAKFSEIHRFVGSERVILVDKMGELCHCYEVSDLAIVGGSFDPRLRGHNVFEPILSGCPVLFGPHMLDQKEMEQNLIRYSGAKQLEVEEVEKVVKMLITRPSDREELLKNGQATLKKLQGSTSKTMKVMIPHLNECNKASKKNM